MRQVFKASFLIVLLLGNASLAFPKEGLQSGTLISLDTALETALQGNKSIQLLQARLEKEGALAKYAERTYWPKVRTNVYGAAVTQKNPGVLFWTNEIAFPIFDGWKARSESRLHLLNQDEVKLAIRSENERIRFEVKKLYIQILAEKEMTLVAQGWMKESRKIYRSFRELYEKELITKREVYHAEALNQSAQYELVSHKRAMDYGAELLLSLLKLPDDTRIELEPLSEIKRHKSDYSEYSENPIYEAVKLRTQEKVEEQKNARSALFPQISVLNRYKIAKDSFLDQNRYEFGIEGTWNIWDFGQTHELIKAKKLETLEAELQGKIEINKFEEEIKKLFVQADIEWKKIQAERASVQEKNEIYENEKTKLIVNEAARLQVFEVYQDFLKAQISYIQTVSNFRVLQAQLEALKAGCFS